MLYVEDVNVKGLENAPAREFNARQKRTRTSAIRDILVIFKVRFV